MSYVNLLEDGKISIVAKSLGEAKIALKELKIKKKELQVQKKKFLKKYDVFELLTRTLIFGAVLKCAAAGWLGKVVRAAQTAERDNARHNLASNIAPYEEKKRWIESALISIDKGILVVEDFILQHS